MVILSYIFSWMKYSYNIGFVFFIIGVGLGSIFLDANQMKSKGLTRESLVSKWIGISYIVISIFLYILVEFII